MTYLLRRVDAPVMPKHCPRCENGRLLLGAYPYSDVPVIDRSVGFLVYPRCINCGHEPSSNQTLQLYKGILTVLKRSKLETQEKTENKMSVPAV